MNPLAMPNTLWAMHPRYLDPVLRQLGATATLPALVGGLVARLAGGVQAMASAPEPGQASGVLVLPIYGLLAPQGMYWGGTAYELIADRVREAAADKRIAAVVLDIRSAGGTVWQCPETADAIYQARSAKPIVAVASPFCFSAAYWLATQAGSFYASPSAEVGSVGVRAGHTDISSFERKIGIRTTLIASTPDKIIANQHEPLGEESRAYLQAGVDEANRLFVRDVARGRRIPAASVGAIHGRGKTFSAPKARMAGAIDGVRTLRSVVETAGSSQSRLNLMRRQAASVAAALSI